MAARADFEIIEFNEHLGDSEEDIDAPAFEFVGNQSSVKTFTIRRKPVEGAYLLIQAFDVDYLSHEIVINDRSLGGFDLPLAPEQWQTWLDVIDTAALRKGVNTLQIRRDAATGDNFLVGTVVVHWKESR